LLVFVRSAFIRPSVLNDNNNKQQRENRLMVDSDHDDNVTLEVVEIRRWYLYEKQWEFNKEYENALGIG
jgi:hypothetical protein